MDIQCDVTISNVDCLLRAESAGHVVQVGRETICDLGGAALAKDICVTDVRALLTSLLPSQTLFWPDCSKVVTW